MKTKTVQRRSIHRQEWEELVVMTPLQLMKQGALSTAEEGSIENVVNEQENQRRYQQFEQRLLGKDVSSMHSPTVGKHTQDKTSTWRYKSGDSVPILVTDLIK